MHLHDSAMVSLGGLSSLLLLEEKSNARDFRYDVKERRPPNDSRVRVGCQNGARANHHGFSQRTSNSRPAGARSLMAKSLHIGGPWTAQEMKMAQPISFERRRFARRRPMLELLPREIRRIDA